MACREAQQLICLLKGPMRQNRWGLIDSANNWHVRSSPNPVPERTEESSSLPAPIIKASAAGA